MNTLEGLCVGGPLDGSNLASYTVNYTIFVPGEQPLPQPCVRMIRADDVTVMAKVRRGLYRWDYETRTFAWKGWSDEQG